MVRRTPEGTLGPFYPGAFAEGMPRDLVRLAPSLELRPAGQGISLAGRVFDSNGAPVRGVVIESWQANAFGRYRHPLDASDRSLDPSFDGFARMRTDEEGRFQLVTVKPGGHPVRAGSGTMRAPHLRLTIFASGIDRLATQIFFEDEAMNEGDPVLTSIGDLESRRRLVAVRSPKDDADGLLAYARDLVLRGERETPFFDEEESAVEERNGRAADERAARVFSEREEA